MCFKKALFFTKKATDFAKKATTCVPKPETRRPVRGIARSGFHLSHLRSMLCLRESKLCICLFALCRRLPIRSPHSLLQLHPCLLRLVLGVCCSRFHLQYGGSMGRLHEA